jgi:hypothetical protein
MVCGGGRGEGSGTDDGPSPSHVHACMRAPRLSNPPRAPNKKHTHKTTPRLAPQLTGAAQKLHHPLVPSVHDQWLLRLLRRRTVHRGATTATIQAQRDRRRRMVRSGARAGYREERFACDAMRRAACGTTMRCGTVRWAVGEAACCVLYRGRGSGRWADVKDSWAWRWTSYVVAVWLLFVMVVVAVVVFSCCCCCGVEDGTTRAHREARPLAAIMCRLL